MQQHFHILLLRSRRAELLLLTLVTLMLLSACSSYSPSRNYPPAYYSFQASAGYHQPNYAYYGAYQPGWFVAAPYFPGNYWGYGAMVYWPTYSSSYYYSNHYYGYRPYYGHYYPYSDPWYYPYSGHYRHIYGHYYGPYNGPYYNYGGRYGSGYRPSSDRPYHGGSHSYRPPSRLHPVATDKSTHPVHVAPAAGAAVVAPGQRGFNASPPAYRTPARGNSASAGRQPHAPGSEPRYQHQLDSGNAEPRVEPRAEPRVEPRVEPRQPRETESGRERDRDRSRQ